MFTASFSLSSVEDGSSRMDGLSRAGILNCVKFKSPVKDVSSFSIIRNQKKNSVYQYIILRDILCRDFLRYGCTFN